MNAVTFWGVKSSNAQATKALLAARAPFTGAGILPKFSCCAVEIITQASSYCTRLREERDVSSAQKCRSFQKSLV